MDNINFDIGDLKDGRFGHHSTGKFKFLFYNCNLLILKLFIPVKLTENGLQLCLDRVASVFNRGGSIIEIIEQYITKFGGGNTRGNRNQENRNSNIRGNRNYQDQFRGKIL